MALNKSKISVAEFKEKSCLVISKSVLKNCYFRKLYNQALWVITIRAKLSPALWELEQLSG